MTEGYQRRRQAITLGLALVASLWIHILGLAMFKYSPAVPATPTSPPMVLEIEMPPPEEEPEKQPPTETAEPQPPPTPEEKPAPAAPAEIPPEVKDMVATGESFAESTPPPIEEETISLESKAPEYLSYLGQVKTRIYQHWIFPPLARQKRQTGQLTAVFTVDNQGQLQRIIVEESSGHPILDHAALEAVRGAAPFGPFPSHINLQRLNIRANFDYRIRYIKVD